MDDIYENIEECNTNKKWKTLIVFDGMIPDMHSNEKLNKIVTDLSLEEENQIFILFLSRNQILKYQKMFY